MENRSPIMYEVPELDAKARRVLIVCGLWMRLGFVGASVAAVGVIQLFGGEASAFWALAMTAGGLALARLSWRRAQAAIGGADAPAAPTEVAPKSRRGRMVASA